MAESSLTQFGRFTESEYHKTPEEIVSDLKNDDKALEKLYTVLNKWITWLGQDHPEIITYLGRYHNIKKTFKAIHPNTQKQYLNHTKCFLEDICYFAARAISASGEVTEFKEFLEYECELGLASDCNDIIESYVENDEQPKEILKSIVKKEPPPSKKQTHTLEALVQKLDKSLRKGIKKDPIREFDIHDAVEALLNGTEFEGKYTHDKEGIPFSATSAKPDFIFHEINTALEIKFCKEKKDVKKLVGEIAEDITLYGKKYKNKIFLVYDMAKITDQDQFKDDFNSIENVIVIIVKH